MTHSHENLPMLPRRLRTFQGVAAILAVLILSLVLPEALPRAKEPRPAASPVNTSTAWTVAAVVDGDTVDVAAAGEEFRVRLLGINTPETVDPRRPVECFGKEASAFATALLAEKTVRLEADPSQDDRDRYGRLLRYVVLDDGRLANEILISEGYAYEYTFERAYRYQQRFRDAERAARLAGKGLWAPDTCAGKRT